MSYTTSTKTRLVLRLFSLIARDEGWVRFDYDGTKMRIVHHRPLCSLVV